MIYDFTTAEMLRLSNVKRWGIVEMSRPQSVAEHTANVALLAMNLIATYNDQCTLSDDDIATLTEKQQLKLLQSCLVHDLPEIYSGDIPAPFKAASGRGVYSQWEEERFPLVEELMGTLDPLVKRLKNCADLIDAILYVRKWCVDARRVAILRDLYRCLRESTSPSENTSLSDRQLRILIATVAIVVNESDAHGGIN